MPAVRRPAFMPPIPGTLIAVDTEGTGLRPHKGHRTFLYTACNDAGDAVALWEDEPINPQTGMFYPIADDRTNDVRNTMRRWMADPAITKVFHNAKYDLKMMAKWGIHVAGTVHDTMIMAHCLSAFGEIGREAEDKKDVKVLKLLALDVLAKKYLNDQKVDTVKAWLREHPLTPGIQVEKLTKGKVPNGMRKTNFSDVPREIMEEYASHDPVLTMKLFYMMNEHLDRLKLRELYNTEMELLRGVIRMEERGVRLDLPFMEQRSKELSTLEATSLVQLRKEAKPIIKIVKKWRSRNKVKIAVRHMLIVPSDKINFRADKQVIKVMQQYGLATQEKTKTGQMKMDERNLSRIDHPFTKELVRWRQYNKTRRVYFEGYMARANGEILHPNLIQIGTATGRFSSQDPNLTNIPMEKVVRERAGADVIYKGVKRAFIPRDGYTNYHFDYSQIEMKMMAHYANDPLIDKAVQERDIHAEITKMLFGDIKDPQEAEYKRVLAKIVSFGVLYGMGWRTFMWKLKVDTRAKVDAILHHYFSTFPGIKRFQNDTIREVRETGQVRNLFGRRYLIHRDKGYKAVNYKCQGGAADLIKRAMVKIDYFFRKERLRSSLLMMVHDELIPEIHHTEDKWLPRKIMELMSDVPECRIPIVVSMERSDGNWENLHKVCLKCGESKLDNEVHKCPLNARWPKIA